MPEEARAQVSVGGKIAHIITGMIGQITVIPVIEDPTKDNSSGEPKIGAVVTWPDDKSRTFNSMAEAEIFVQGLNAGFRRSQAIARNNG